MSHAEKFYPNLHTVDKGYSAGEYHMESLFGKGVLRDWAEKYRGRSVRLLDVGCGKAVFLRDFADGLRQRWGAKEIQATGVDLVRSPGNNFDKVCDNFQFVQQNLDGQTLPFKDGSFDFVCCNQVMEHVFETEKLIREFRRVLDPGGLCIISVPNVACWPNRLFFLFGGQPLGSELGSEKVTYGFWPPFLTSKLEEFRPSGHIRDFTPRGLRDLTEHCGFKAIGWWPQSKGFLARLGKSAGRDIGILLSPNK